MLRHSPSRGILCWPPLLLHTVDPWAWSASLARVSRIIFHLSSTLFPLRLALVQASSPALTARQLVSSHHQVELKVYYLSFILRCGCAGFWLAGAARASPSERSIRPAMLAVWWGVEQHHTTVPSVSLLSSSSRLFFKVSHPLVGSILRCTTLLGRGSQISLLLSHLITFMTHGSFI